MALIYTAPTPELAVELNEVRADAAVLADVFSQLNAPLPEDFPKDAVLELAAALHALPNGTARGCLRPLNEAQSQLATIRSQHIRHDHPEEGWDVDRPPLFRGEPVDQRLRGLMSSVSTALQTANSLAADEPELEVPEAGDEPPGDASTAQLIQKSSKAQQELEGERRELDSLHIKSDHADTLSRRLTDTVILNQLGRGELRLPRIVSARLRRIANTLRDYPALLQKAAELITAGTHFADYAHEKWSSLETRLFNAGTTTIREIADDLTNFARKLEANRKPTEATANKPDFDLDEAVKMIHMGHAIPMHWRDLVVDLPLGNRRLKSLEPLAGLINLRSFVKPSVKVEDISPLAELQSLRALNLDYTQVSDLSPVSSLYQLHTLSFTHTPVSDLRPLTSLARLKNLSFSFTKISDLTPISGLFELQSIWAFKTDISDIAALAQLRRLRQLDLDDTQVSELEPLLELTDLAVLDLRNTNVTEISALKKLSKLKRLDLRGTQVKDLAPISNLPALGILDVSNTKVSNLECFVNHSAIERLDISNTPVDDLQPLATLDNLTHLQIGDTLVSDISPVSRCPNLRSLNLSRTKISDLSSLKDTRINSLSIVETPITDLTCLKSLTNLSYLSISKDLESKVPDILRTRKVHIYVASKQA
jgi:Leucine-rich repeat (LRR) protein